MMKKFARLFSLLLTLVMLVTLCGCSLLDTLSNLIQKKMSDDQLDAALAKIDAAALAASFSTGANVTGAETVYGYYGKINGGNTTALVCGVPQFNLLLTTGGKKDVNLHLGDGVEFFTDKEGEFYISTVEETVWGRDAAGRESGRTRLTKYNRWNGSDWTPAYTVQDAINSITQVTVTKYFKGDLETQINEEEFKQFTPTAYKTPVGTLNTCTFEATYRDHLVESLDQYLDENYSYHSIAKRNIDADRDNEIIITIQDFLQPWVSRLSGQIDGNETIAESAFGLQHLRTVFLIIDTNGRNIDIAAYATMQGYEIDANNLNFNSYGITFDNHAIYIPSKIKDLAGLGEKEQQQLYSVLERHFKEQLFDNIFFCKTDISDLPGEELLCVGSRYGEWHTLLLSFNADTPYCIWKDTLSSSALFLIEYNGAPALLTYDQGYSYTGLYGQFTYSYQISRIDKEGKFSDLESKEISYSSKDSSATFVSEFFAKFNQYLADSPIVIHDPYLLTGQQWMTKANITFGSRPAQSIFPGETYEEDTGEKLGFVYDVRPDSWLHLRVGPGTEYDLVLVDPANPESFVRQALGSPVTILEEIHTGDAQNPDWVRIRINYGDQVLFGYSSKKYIMAYN